MTKPDIYNRPSDPIEEYEYPLEKISKKWTNQIANYLTQTSAATKDALRTAYEQVSQVPVPTVPDFIKNIPTEIKQVYAPDEDLIPNMGYVLASGAGTSILLKKRGIITRAMVPATAVMLTFYFLYPKTSGNVIENCMQQSPKMAWRPPLPISKRKSVTGKCWVAVLPSEIMIIILSHLDPIELTKVTGVCKRWNTIISDDSCWRLAMQMAFGILPIRRITTGSWRREYLTRRGLLNEWGRGRQAVTFEPRIGKIQVAYMSWDDCRLYAGSIEKGMVSICQPLTGKVEKESIFCGDEDRVPMQISVLKIDGYSFLLKIRNRIIIGHLTGQLALITNFKDRMDYSMKRFQGFHDGPVNCISWSSNFTPGILSGGSDTMVKLWNANDGTCRRNLTGSRSKITYISFDSKNHILASSEDGKILIWDLDISSILKEVESTNVPSVAASRVVSFNINRAVNCLIYDPESRSCLTVYPASSSLGLKRWSAKDSSIVCNFDNSHLSEMSCAVWDRLVSGKTEKNTSILVTGDTSGKICVWEIPESGSTSPLLPLRMISNAHQMSLSLLYVDPFKILSVDISGVIRVWDLMTTKCIRAFNVPRNHREAEELRENKTVHLVCVGPYQVIAAIGNSIRSWNFDSFYACQFSGKKKRDKLRSSSHSRPHGLPRSGSKLQSRSPRQQFLSEMREEISRVNEDMEFEKYVNDRNTRQSIKFNGTSPGNKSGLTEEEMISYAMMLSMEENQGNDSKMSSSYSKSIPVKSPSRHYNASTSRINSWNDRFKSDDWEEDDWEEDPDTAEYYSPSKSNSLDLDSSEWLSTSDGKRRLFYGMNKVTSSRRNSNSDGSISSRHASGAGGILLRSPGLVPVDMRQGNVRSVMVNDRDGWDDEELQYVLEMSLHDK